MPNENKETEEKPVFTGEINLSIPFSEEQFRDVIEEYIKRMFFDDQNKNYIKSLIKEVLQEIILVHDGNGSQYIRLMVKYNPPPDPSRHAGDSG
jgi:hypothetical protein